MSEPRRLRKGEGYGACDAAGANEKAPYGSKKGPRKRLRLWGKAGKRSVAFSRSTSLGGNDCLGRLAGKQSHLCAE